MMSSSSELGESALPSPPPRHHPTAAASSSGSITASSDGTSSLSSSSGSLGLSFLDLRVSSGPSASLCERLCGSGREAARARGQHRAGTKHILSRCSGVVPPRALTVVMGGSGAGKTTLLNFLAHRLPGCGAAHADGGSIGGSSEDGEEVAAALGGFTASGSIHVNGQQVSSKFFAKVCAYVPQQSILLSALTPRESIRFASRLRLPYDTSEEEHERNTERVITALSLHSCADTRIGDELTGGGLSGGEKRRVNIGVELVTNPPLLCLDEPTTGLDSLTALNVLKSLKQLTKGSVAPVPTSSSRLLGREAGSPSSGSPSAAVSPMQSGSAGGVTVLCSIHQPSCEMFDLFDQLILLSAGVIVYCGPASDAIAYFSRLSYPCPPLENPPEYFLDLIISNPPLLARFEQAWRDTFDRKYRHLHARAARKMPRRAMLPSAVQQQHQRIASDAQQQKSVSARDDTPEPAGPSVIHQRKPSFGSSNVSFSTPSPSPNSKSPLSNGSSITSSSPVAVALSPMARGTQRLDLNVGDGELARTTVKARIWAKLQKASPKRQPPIMDVIDEQENSDHAPLHQKAPPLSPTPPPTVDLRTQLRASYSQLSHLTHRAYLNSSRLPLLKGAQVLQTVVLGLLVGLAFMGLGFDQTSVQNRLGCVYFINICVVFANTLSVVLTFAEDRALFLREQGNGMYSVWSAFVARLSIEVVPTFLCSLGLALICFWMIAPAASGAVFGRFLLLIVLLAYAGQGIGLVVSCGIASRMLAMIVTPLAIAPFILATPYAISESAIPPWFRPFQVGSPFWWGFTGLMITLFDGLKFHCTSAQTIAIPMGDGSFYLLCPYQTGVGVLGTFGIQLHTAAGEDVFWVCCGVLIVLCVIYRLLALIMLYAMAWQVKDAVKPRKRGWWL